MEPHDATNTMYYAKQQAMRQHQLAQSQVSQGAILGKPPEQPHTLAMRDAISNAHQLASETHSIISGLSDRLFGCDAPMNANGACALQSVPNGSADEALHSARVLCQALSTLRAEASRLESRL